MIILALKTIDQFCLISIFEKVLFNRMESFIKKNYLLFPSEFSFCKAHSTQHAILEIVYTIQTNMGKRLFSSSCGIFIDIKTAFDTVDHKIILDKLYQYGFCCIINKWFSSYLEGRTQTTQIVSFIPREKKKKDYLFSCSTRVCLGSTAFSYLK